MKEYLACRNYGCMYMHMYSEYDSTSYRLIGQLLNYLNLRPCPSSGQKQLGGFKGLIWFILPPNFHHQRVPGQGLKQNRNLQGKSCCRSHGGVLLSGLLSLLSYEIQENQPRVSRMGGPSSIHH